MRPILLVLSVLLLSGCAASLPFDVQLDLSVRPQPAGVFPTIIAAKLESMDKRDYREVIVYQIKSDPAVRILARTAPQTVLADRLVTGFREQGLVFVQEAPVRFVLEVEQLLATVDRPSLLYEAKAVSAVALTVHNAGNSLAKRYTKESTRSSATRPKPAELEAMLSEQLSSMVEQILEDRDIRKVISGS